MRLMQYQNTEEISERAADNNQVKAKYVGPKTELKNTKGEAYFNKQDDRWYYRPVIGDQRGDWYRVREANIWFI